MNKERGRLLRWVVCGSAGLVAAQDTGGSSWSVGPVVDQTDRAAVAAVPPPTATVGDRDSLSLFTATAPNTLLSSFNGLNQEMGGGSEDPLRSGCIAIAVDL